MSHAGSMPVAGFVGRQRELDFLSQRLDEVVAGRPQVVVIGGDPGCGKTRLVKELFAIAQERRIDVCHGRCHEDIRLPYLPFAEGLFSHLTEVRADGGDEDVALIRDLLGSAASPRESVAAGGEQAKLRVFLAATRATLAFVRRVPLILALDDLHWADAASLELFRHLAFASADAARRQPVPLLMVATTRPLDPQQPAGRVAERLRREEDCHLLELGGLGAGEVRDLIAALGLERPSQQLTALVAETTHGNPLFIQEVVRHLVERKALATRGGYLVATVDAGELQLPADARAAIAERLQVLSADCREVLSLASFLGMSFSFETLRAVCGLPEDTLLELLEEGMREGLLRVESVGLQFEHPLTRQVLYSTSSNVRRRLTHLRIAETLERLAATAAAPPTLEIAQHLIHAEALADAGKVIDYARRAGDSAFAVFAWGEAARYYESALAAAEREAGVLDPREHADLHQRAAHAYYRAADAGPCYDQFAKAAAAFRRLGDVKRLAETLLGQAQARFSLDAVPYGVLIDEVESLRAVLDELPENEVLLRGRIFHILSEVHWHARRADDAERFGAEALAIARSLGDDKLSCDAWHGLALAHMQRLRIAEAIAHWRESLLSADRSRDAWAQTCPLTRLAMTLLWVGELEEAANFAQRGRDLARQIHNWAEVSVATATFASLAVVRGDFAAAERWVEETMGAMSNSRYPWGAVIALPALAGARALRGAFAEAEDAVDVLVEKGRVFDDPGDAMHGVVWIYRELLRLQALPDHAADVRSALAMAALIGDGVPDTGALASLCALAEIGQRAGSVELMAAVEAPLRMAAERGVVVTSGWPFLVPRVIATIAAARHDWSPAAAHFAAAVNCAQTMGAEAELARCRLDEARMLVARGDESDADRALDLLRDAVRVFHARWLAPFVRESEEVARCLGADLPAPVTRRAGASGLSDLEERVLLFLARGRSDREIADATLLSAASLARISARLFERIDLPADTDRRTAAAAYAAQLGLIERRREDLSLRGTAAGAKPLRVLLFTDMADYTGILQELGDERTQDLLRRHNEMIRDCLHRYGGIEVKHTGDGILAWFASAADALRAARDMQEAFRTHNASTDERAMSIRIGLHAGEPIADEGDLFGAAVNACARICARADPGEILVSDVVRKLAAGAELRFADRGRVHLKGFTKRFRLFAMGE